MLILIANLGSTSYKFRLFRMGEQGHEVLGQDGYERVDDHGVVIGDSLDKLESDGVIGSRDEITAVGFKTVLGRGLGAYVALQIAGARAAQIHGVILTDGPGLAGGPTGPSSQSFFSLETDGTAPDPYALVELGRDLRPGDYAVSFVNLANAGAGLSNPITVASSFQPKWLAAVAESPGVAEASLADALASYA